MPPTASVTVYSTVHSDPYLFIDCRWKVDEERCLHIFRSSEDRNTMVAAFNANQWTLVHADAEVWSS